jgi:hypothetical protein
MTRAAVIVRGIIACSFPIRCIHAFMRSALIRKIGGIVGLLAILMTTLAPAASQMLERTRIESMLAAFCSAETPAVSSHGNTARSKHASSDAALAHLQACGYCNLASHTPFTPPPAHAHRMPALADPAPVARLDTFQRPHAAIIAAQPRAPPSFA